MGAFGDADLLSLLQTCGQHCVQQRFPTGRGKKLLRESRGHRARERTHTSAWLPLETRPSQLQPCILPPLGPSRVSPLKGVRVGVGGQRRGHPSPTMIPPASGGWLMASCVGQGQAGCLGVPQPHHLAHSLPSLPSRKNRRTGRSAPMIS